VIEERERTYVPGGAANVAVNAVCLGAKANLFGVIGEDADGGIFRQRLKKAGVGDDGIISVPGRPTTRKTRLIARGNQVLRVDRETTESIGEDIEWGFARRIANLSGDIVVVSDYAKGVVTPGLVAKLNAAGKRIIVDPKSPDFSLYSGVFLIKPNYPEFCKAAGRDTFSTDEIERTGRELIGRHGIQNMLVTLGPNGMLLIESDGPATHIHTRAREVFDVTGAGDTVIAAIAASLAAGANLAESCTLATFAAGIVVGKHHTATATPSEILDYAFGTSSSDKIIDLDTIVRRTEEYRKTGRTIVFTNGCFDILHMGHITYLNEARGHGDVLIVGVNTDASIRRLKGPSRPIIPEIERSHVLASLECVDHVVLFDEDTPLELIQSIRPDILVKGADYTREQVVGHDIVESYGGEVRLIPVVGSLSTSAIIDRIKKSG
jgi:D-beta-D-heptose 7-phosphate kinase/D-beta-D-heptose 1-phosphate adenosyltransferase